MTDRSSDPFPVEFDTQAEELTDELKNQVEQDLHRLGRGHQDIVGASLSADEPVKGETGHHYEVRIVLFMRPENIFAKETDDTLEGALTGAMQAIERQVRADREKRGEPWKRPGRSKPRPQ